MSTSNPRLEPVTAANFDAVCAVSVRPDQTHLVSPVVKSLAEAYVHPAVAWPRAIVDDDTVVGFVMAFLDCAWDDNPDDVRFGIWRLNISAGHQGKGYGRFAVEAICAELRGRGVSRAYVTWDTGTHTPEPFYLGLGFRRTGELSGNQTVGVRAL
ncbi:GNAT family N-acetyltransferase [Streptomyces sp. NPDC090022]|uniref:GNAT family N-acetyltransferase n=1 Tax=Streptomyces sp. NPDC090022 TaxID=3365920 RepID=UPI00382D02C6